MKWSLFLFGLKTKFSNGTNTDIGGIFARSVILYNKSKLYPNHCRQLHSNRVAAAYSFEKKNFKAGLLRTIFLVVSRLMKWYGKISDF